jgi:beta-lactam-binding protein with PASTA domain
VVVELEQWNPNGTWCKVGVVLQDEAATTPVPDVAGETLEDATTAIEDAGLIVGTVTEAFSPSVPLGEVISQTPLAAVRAVYGAAVALVISLGPEAL